MTTQTTTEHERQLRGALRLRRRPDVFARRVLGFEPTPWQEDIMRAVAKSERVSVTSGHKIGKSVIGAAIGIWFVSVHPGARVVMTAPTGHQVEDILWREVGILYDNAVVPIGGRLYKQSHKGLVIRTKKERRELFSLSVKENEAFSGVSAPYVMYIVDEASGVPRDIFEAIEGNRAGGAKLLLLGNPTQPTGEFFDSHHRRRKYYVTFRVSSRRAAEYRENVRRIRGLAQMSWVRQKDEEWGIGTPVHDIRLEGRFPQQSINSVVGLATREAAKERHGLHLVGGGRLNLGVDVAREGDDETVIAKRRDDYIWPLRVHTGETDSYIIADAVIEEAKAAMAPGEGRIPGTKKPLVKVDLIGWGAGTYDVLRKGTSPTTGIKYSDIVDVIPVNVAENADDKDEYVRLRDQLWFGLRNYLQDGGSIPPDDELDEELLAPKYTFDARGRYRVDPKDKIKEDLGRSPDRADAVSLAVYNPGNLTRYNPQAGNIRGL